MFGTLPSGAGARPVAIAGLPQAAALDTRTLPGGEMLAVWTLPRLGVSVRNDPEDLRLLLGTRELRYSPATGWRALGFAWTGRLAAPQQVGVSLYVPLAALKLLGVRTLADAPGLLDFAAPVSVPQDTLPPSDPSAQTAGSGPGSAGAAVTAPRPRVPAPTPPPSAPVLPAVSVAPAVPTLPHPPAPAAPAPALPVPPAAPTLNVPVVAHLDTVRVSRTLYRTVEVQRVVLELSAPAPQSVAREAGGLSVTLPGVTVQASEQRLPSGDTLSLRQLGSGAVMHLTTGGGRSEIFTLEDPYRVVIDTTTHTDPGVPPPLNPDALPPGVTYRERGALKLLSFDPGLFQPRVVSAPPGRALGVAELVKSVAGVAGINGGYFDPASSLPVDLVAVGGLMTAGSLERRATVGFTAQGQTLFGYPRPRYVLSSPEFGSVTVNSVKARPDASLLTAFVGDGRTPVGAGTLTTLLVSPGSAAVTRAVSGQIIPPAGMLALTFDPARFPALPRVAGAPLKVTLNWQATDAPWDSAVDALSAGPLLVQGGKVAIDPRREGFNTAGSIWRPTRQSALGVLNGQPTIAYFDFGTPEAFAAALAGAGVRDAVRMDSGSSATAYLRGGYADLGAYLNTVWSRPVPNAIVFVPRGTAIR
ncbi:hypothetical protein GCM10010841_20440 [Deinococcus aerophilus]|uniref:Phosphodiester glycosidase domain-containing protein n=1 Tax=Deinococcus aerophilus TaxID=522488 RepID=A0ABQ2GU23_9DEIO|nr:hypothetical protein GCM10010841_20440 [Deinococcus aerophilus]